jgi:hypothetical protein
MMSACRQFVTDKRPIMKHGRIEVSAVRPRQRSGFSIKSDKVEERQVGQRSKQNAFQHRMEIDSLFRAVLKRDVQDVRSGDFKAGNAMDGVAHGLSEWLDLDRRLTGLQQISIPNQFLAMNLHPCFDETPLRSR